MIVRIPCVDLISNNFQAFEPEIYKSRYSKPPGLSIIAKRTFPRIAIRNSNRMYFLRQAHG